MTPKRLFFFLLGLLAITAVSGLSAYYLSHQKLSQKIDTTSRLTADIVLERERLKDMQKLDSDYGDSRELSEKAERVLPGDKQQSEVTAQLFALIDQAGLNGSGITYEATSGSPSERSQTGSSQVEGVLVMPANFQVTGSYRQLLQFLHNIERNERIMQVKSLDIGRQKDGQLSFSVEVEVFIKS